MSDHQAQRVIAGHKRPGEPLRIFGADGELSRRLSAPAPTRKPEQHGGNMTTSQQPISTPGTGPMLHFEAYDAQDNLIVSVRAPVKVAAEAARNWADVVNPYEGPAGIDARYIPWRVWLSKLLPFLKR